jgi:RNA polymerase sigma-70 factor, ECF subfamily
MTARGDRRTQERPSVYETAELGELFERHRPRLRLLVQGRIDPPLAAKLDADDVIAEAYRAAGRRWEAFKANRQVSDFLWLYRIVGDTFVEMWRKATAGKRDAYREACWNESGSVDLGARLAAAGPGPATEVSRREQLQLVRRAIAQLTPDDRDVLWFRDRDQLSFAEIGEHLGLTADAATKRYVRAVAKLKRAYLALGGDSRP